jgi:heme/copper-type cytochrome/quinol oxidase subunit 2
VENRQLPERKNKKNLGRRNTIVLLLGTVACTLTRSFTRLLAQDQTANRREFTVTARNYLFVPALVEVMQGELVRITLHAEDQAHSFTIDEYRIAKLIPANGTTILDFQADQAGKFIFYCNFTKDSNCQHVRGELIVEQK